MPTEKISIKYQIEGMDCADCALSLERSLAQLKGVEQVQVNFSTGFLQASGEFDPQEVVRRVQDMGYRAALPNSGTDAPPEEGGTSTRSLASRLPQNGVFGFLAYLLADRQTAVALISALLLLASAPLSLWQTGAISALIVKLIHVGVILLAGAPIARRGLKALFIGRQVTIDLLMSVAAVGALFIGESGEAATVILLFSIGEALEGYTAERARSSLRSLLTLKPQRAAVLRPCMDCTEHLGQEDYTGGPCPFCEFHETVLPVEQVRLGEIVLIRPAERIPVDGQVISGTSAVNQAAVTGESMPVTKEPGSPVFAGTLNGEAALEVEVTHLAQDSTIAQIVRLVEEAQSKRAPVERFVDRFAAWYTPAVVVAAALLAVIPPLLGGPFWDGPDGAHGWLYRSLALLIIACPCALVISTPVTIVSALTSLARRGVLVKGGAFLDALAGVRVFAFDKTGTLTTGRPVVNQALTLDCLPGQARCSACDDMLVQAAAVESRSEHPLAQAILAETQSRQLSHSIPHAQNVVSMAGKGVQGIVNGAMLTVGSHAHGHEAFSEDGSLHQEIVQAEAVGQTVMLVSRDDQVVGFVGVSDPLRSSSRQALLALKEIDPRLHTVMLTGDNPQVAAQIAAGLGPIDEVLAGLLPAGKVETVRSLQARFGPVAMVGDGINDAPALAAATVGIAMGGAGTAQAMETADVILMQDDLTHLPELLRTSRQAKRIIWQNIGFSLAIKLLFLALTLPGWSTLWMAVFADMGASLLVTLNGMRLLSRKTGL